MATFEFTSPEGKTYTVNGPDGATKEQAFQMLQTQLGGKQATAPAPKPEEPFGQRLTREIKDIPRQVGLTARHGIEGVGDTLEFLSSPIRGALNAVLPKQSPTITDLVTGNGQKKDAIQPGAGQYVADLLGLPKPQNSTERVVGDAARLMAGSVVPMSGAGKLADGTTGMTKTVLQGLASNPGSQVTSAAAAGGAGGYTRETGGDPVAQFVASMAAGIGAPLALSKAQQLGTSAATAVRNRVNPAPVNAQIDVTINGALKDSGLTLADLPTNVRNSIRTDVQKALNMEGTLSPDGIRRLADYRMTGTTPRVGTLTLDPVQITQEKNLAKIGANSKDPAAQQLAQVENANNRQLISGLNDLGAVKAPGEFATGDGLIKTLQGFAKDKEKEIGALYGAAKDTQGRAAALDHIHFTNVANDLLDYNLKGAFLPKEFRTILNSVAEGKIPFNVNTAEQLKTMLATSQRTAKDGNQVAALGFVRDALDNTPVVGELGEEALSAFNRARSTTKAYKELQESTPALRATLNDAAPDRFFQKHVLNAPARDVQSMLDIVGDNPAAIGSIKSEMLGYLKSKALNGADDEIGNFSQSAFRRALKSIGDQKLGLLFNPEEIQQLKAIKRVAGYEQVQPRGAAVNNSNTASAAAGLLERIGNSSLLSKIPVGRLISEPVQNISVGIQSGQAINAPRGLLQQIPLGPRQPIGLLMSPAAFMQPEDDRQPRGLLFP